MSENMIAHEPTEVEVQAEELAFETAFNTDRGIEAEPAPAADPEPKVEEPAKAESIPNGDGVTDAPAAEPERKPITIGGLNEEQIAAALSRIGAMQSAIDKMAGRNGQLMQQIEQLRNNPPQNAAQQRALDIKLSKLSEGFPELAKLLQEDLQASLSAGAPAADKPGSATLTPELIEAKVAERLAPMREEMEIKVLSVVHPDWMEIIRTPEFALFRDNVLPPGEGQKLMESEDAAYISSKLTQFKSWHQAATAPATPTTPTTPATPSPQARRLSAAVLPAGAAPAVAPVQMTEEDGFEAGFRAERKRTGR